MREGAPSHLSGQTYLISVFAGLLFAAIIRQNQPFRRGRRHLALFAAHIREYSSALDARKARPARQRARPFGPPSGRFPRKKRHFPCQRRRILLQPLRRRKLRMKTAIGYAKLYPRKSLSLSVAVLSLSVRRPAATAKATRLRRERLKQAADAATASAFFRILPAPAIRLRFASAEQRGLCSTPQRDQYHY